MKLDIWELHKIEKMLQNEVNLIEDETEKNLSNEQKLADKFRKEIDKELKKIKYKELAEFTAETLKLKGDERR